ncbi:MAG: hypothetical protein IJA58_05060 [Lachnospiraceae bacterium]|nr:hypothetical protein [Lachnospiraceae bacterium]
MVIFECTMVTSKAICTVAFARRKCTTGFIQRTADPEGGAVQTAVSAGHTVEFTK